MFIFMNVLLCKLCGTGRDNHGPGLRTLVFHSAAPSKVHDVNKNTSFSEPLPGSSVLIHGWRMMIFISCSYYEVQVQLFSGYKSGFQVLNATQLSGISEQV